MKTRFAAIAIYAVVMLCCHQTQAQYTGTHGERYTDYEQYRFFKDEEAIWNNVNTPVSMIGVPRYNYPAGASAKSYSQYRSKLTPEEQDEYLNNMKRQSAAYDEQYRRQRVLALQRNCYLFLYRGNGFTELRNAAGKAIIRGNFEDVQEVKYSNGAPSSWIVSNGGKYSLIGQSDTLMVLKASGFDQISRAGPTDQDCFLMTGSDGKTGVFDGHFGRLVMPVKFDAVDLTNGAYSSDSRVPVKNDGKWGLWNWRDSSLVVPYDYDGFSYALDLNENYIDGAQPVFVNRGGKWGVYDVAKRKEIVPAIYDKIASCEYDGYNGGRFTTGGGRDPMMMYPSDMDTNSPVFVCVANGQKFYYNRYLALHKPDKAPLFGLGFKGFILPDLRFIDMPESLAPHSKKEAKSPAVIDAFFSFDKM